MKNANCKLQIADCVRRRAFTLMEVLIVMLIIAILAALALMALQGAAEEARADRTRMIIAKLDQLLKERFDSYRTRPLPIRIPSGAPSAFAATMRLYGVRDLMRLELPDRKSDVLDLPADIDPRLDDTSVNPPIYYRYYLNSGPVTPPLFPSPIALQRTYLRKALAATGNNLANWDEVNQSSECLYLIVSTMHDGDKNALDFFMPAEMGDTEDPPDGMREILDGWGRPINFLRWAPGFTVQNGQVTLQTSDATVAPDPFDPAKADPLWHDATTGNEPFALRPLIFSGGRDKSNDIVTDNAPIPPNAFHRYCPTSATGNNWPQPYAPLAIGVLIGTPQDTDGDGYPEWADNITNHFQPTNAP
jgi:prepilin-type N-terminal cleavage/methylation domain-containing protein